MDSGVGWTVNATDDTAWEFGWDFTTMGVPPSPSGSTTGLRMAANIVSPTGSEKVVATPTDFSIAGKYTMEFDFWINVNGPLPGGGGGSTEFIGGGVGYDGVTPDRNGALLIITGEGGSSRDWRMYKNTGEQFVASAQYDIDTNNNSGVDLGNYFPSQSPPQYQQDNFPQQTGQTATGCGGFAWHHMTITVDSTAEPPIANFNVDGLSIGDNGRFGSLIDPTGNIEVMYADLFSSVSDNAQLSFGVIDNLVVSSPRLDIKPGSCPNSFNRKSHGVLPVAFLGGEDLDIGEIDLSTVFLTRADGVGGAVATYEGPPGPHTEFEDVATPFVGLACDCNEYVEGDGIDDLSMKFLSDEVVESLELNDLDPGALVELVLSGALFDGTPFEASDCIRLVPPGTPPGLLSVGSDVGGTWVDVSPLDDTLDGGGFAYFERSFPMTSVVTLKAEPEADGQSFLGWWVNGRFHEAGQSTTSLGSFNGQSELDTSIKIKIAGNETVYALYSSIEAPTEAPEIQRPTPGWGNGGR
jgi:hypothetical protein